MTGKLHWTVSKSWSLESNCLNSRPRAINLPAVWPSFVSHYNVMSLCFLFCKIGVMTIHCSCSEFWWNNMKCLSQRVLINVNSLPHPLPIRPTRKSLLSQITYFFLLCETNCVHEKYTWAPPSAPYTGCIRNKMSLWEQLVIHTHREHTKKKKNLIFLSLPPSHLIPIVWYWCRAHCWE